MRGKLTKYQIELMQLVLAGSPAGDGPLDFDQLLETVSWSPTKAAAHFSIRALSRRDLIQKLETLQLRRGRLRVCFELTETGKQALDPRLTPKLGTAGVITSELFAPKNGINNSEINDEYDMQEDEFSIEEDGSSLFIEEI